MESATRSLEGNGQDVPERGQDEFSGARWRPNAVKTGIGKAIRGTEDWHDFECNELTAEEIDKFVSGAPGKSSEQRITFLSDQALEL